MMMLIPRIYSELHLREVGIKKGFLILIALFLQACAVAPQAFLEQAKHPTHNFLATDSRVRIIATAQQGIFSTTGLVEPKRIICTEPSPDVATTLSNSLGVGISILGQGAGSLSTQQVEGLVQLGERTAAIQLLRDKMYQTCLAYANGAISGTTYSLIMSRLDDSIVTLSLGDGAAGAFGRKLAAIGGESQAKAEATLIGLPGEISKIEEQAGKLAAANKRVDDAEKALQAHKSKKPEAGKEEEHNAQTTKLETELAKAKGERNALLELMRGALKSASEASGKINQIQAGGGLTARPAVNALREMQADFLLTDVNKDLIFACLVELGLREGKGGNSELKKMTTHLENLFKKGPNATTGGNYAAAILRARGTALATFCNGKLQSLISDATNKFHQYRMLRAQLNADTSNMRYASEKEKARAKDRELFIDSIKLCNSEFKNDANRKKACLDKVIPIKSASQPPVASAKKKPPVASAKKKPPIVSTTSCKNPPERLYVLRHARLKNEKDKSKNSPLSNKGEQMALDLAIKLKGTPINVIYTSKTMRTSATARPLAKNRGLGEPNQLQDNEILQKLCKDHSNQVVLVVGHQNTIQNFLKRVDVKKEDIDKVKKTFNGYGNLYEVLFVNGKAKLTTSKYSKL